MVQDKEYYSVEEVADLLGVNYQLIYKLVRSGELPAARIGRVYRVLRRDLDAYVESTKTGPAAACAACGKAYASARSVGNQCLDCEERICLDCWTRLGVRRCREHGGEKKDRG